MWDGERITVNAGTSVFGADEALEWANERRRRFARDEERARRRVRGRG